MSKTMFYRQCELHKNLPGGGIMSMVSFIPEKFAILGNMLRIRDDRGVWMEGWEVKSTGDSFAVPDVDLLERDHLRNRKASDI